MSKAKTKILAFAMACLLALPMAVAFANPAAAKAEINSNSVGNIIVNDVKDSEEFTAVRVIETTYDGAIFRTFAPGFSYGDNSDNRSDDGLSAYLALSETAAINDAVNGFAKQISDTSESYHVVSANGQARFENLPMGQYVIIGTPADETRIYQKMLGNVEPVMADGEYGILPVEISAKYEDIIIEKPKLTIDKSADKELVYRGVDLAYKVVVAPGEGSSAVRNVHIVDALDDATIAAGMKLNQDVKITFGDGSAIEDAVIVYTNVNGSTVGYTIDIPGEFAPDTKFVVEYTADTTGLAENTPVTNIARTWCDDVEPVDDTVIIPPDDTLTITGNPTPGGQEDGKMQQTGDILPYVFGGIAGLAAIVLVIVLIVRRRRDEK